MNCEVEDDRSKQKEHLYLEWLTRIALHRFRREQHDARGQDNDQAPECPRGKIQSDLLNRLVLHDDLAKPQIEDDDRAEQDREGQQMKRLDNRKINPRTSDGFTHPRGIAPLK